MKKTVLAASLGIPEKNTIKFSVNTAVDDAKKTIASSRHRFFPELWDIRAEMTDRWGAEYGVKRDSISGPSAAGHGSGL